MAEASAATELVALFETASKAADRAVSKEDGAVLAAEEARCKDALKAMGAVEVCTALLLSTQVCVGVKFFRFLGLVFLWLKVVIRFGRLALLCMR